MAAPKGNQFWKARSKHGRDSIVQDVETLENAADEYFQWCDDNPILEMDYKVAGGEIVPVSLPHPRAFKKEEFARWCGLSEWRLVTDLANKGEDFSQVITRIEKTIADQKYDYAVVGMFNATIVARDLGLSDRQDVKQEVTSNQLEVVVKRMDK